MREDRRTPDMAKFRDVAPKGERYEEREEEADRKTGEKNNNQSICEQP